MDLNKKVQSPWATVQSATARASYENLPQEFEKLNLGGPRKSSGGSNRNRKRFDSRKKLRKNRRATKTRRYKK